MLEHFGPSSAVVAEQGLWALRNLATTDSSDGVPFADSAACTGLLPGGFLVQTVLVKYSLLDCFVDCWLRTLVDSLCGIFIFVRYVSLKFPAIVIACSAASPLAWIEVCFVSEIFFCNRCGT